MLQHFISINIYYFSSFLKSEKYIISHHKFTIFKSISYFLSLKYSNLEHQLVSQWSLCILILKPKKCLNEIEYLKENTNNNNDYYYY